MENYDSYWIGLGDPMPSHNHSYTFDSRGGYQITTTGSSVPDSASMKLLMERLSRTQLKAAEQLYPEKFTELLKEVTSVPPVKTEREEIDAAVEEAIAKPRREREIAKRVAAVQALGEDEYEDGTVLRFKRRYGKTDYSYAVLKAAGKWYGTSSSTGISYVGCTWEVFVKWATTGESMIFDLEVAASWTPVALA